MRAEPTAPLDAELVFAGRRLEGARLAGAKAGSIDQSSVEEFRMRAVSLRGLEVGGDAAAEFARQSVDEGMVEMELRLTGAFKYRPVHVGGSKRLDVRCPLKLPVVPAPPTPGVHFMSTVFDKVSITCY